MDRQSSLTSILRSWLVTAHLFPFLPLFHPYFSTVVYSMLLTSQTHTLQFPCSFKMSGQVHLSLLDRPHNLSHCPCLLPYIFISPLRCPENTQHSSPKPHFQLFQSELILTLQIECVNINLCLIKVFVSYLGLI